MKPLGIQLYSVREQAKDDFPGTLKEIADIGYAGLELAGLHGYDAGEVRKILDDLGLRASSAHAPLPTRETLGQVVDQARTLGYSTLVLPFLPPESFADVDEINKTADRLQQAAAMLEEHDLSLAYHNHAHEMKEVDGEYIFSRLLSSAPKLWAQIDVYWASRHGEVDPAGFVKTWRERAWALHLKDGPLAAGEPMVAAGKGKMDLAACVQAADDATLQWLIVELDTCATDMMQAVRESYQYLTDERLASGTR